MTTAPLKLRAQDAEDVRVISAVLQDAIAPVCDMLYNPAEKNFIMVVHRLRRENENAPLDRICCAINLRGVESVKTQGIDLNRQERMLDLLAVMPEKQTIDFVFAGNAEIRIQLGEWSVFVEDFGDAWPATCSPCHDAATG